jgi:flagellar biogenesis protein FliO
MDAAALPTRARHEVTMCAPRAVDGILRSTQSCVPAESKSLPSFRRNYFSSKGLRVVIRLMLVVIFTSTPSLAASEEDFAAMSVDLQASRAITPPSSDPASAASPPQSGSLVTTLGALGLILMILLGLVGMWKKRSPLAARPLPEDVWQELGGKRLDHRFQIRLIRVGSRVLVLGQSETSLQTLSEITGSEEVADLVARCAHEHAGRTGSRFQSLYEQFRSRIGLSEPDSLPNSASSRESQRA